MSRGSARGAVVRLAAVSPFVVVAVLVLVSVLLPGVPPSAGAAGLDPVPAPPPITLAPGAARGGPLTIVAARPTDELLGNATPTVTFSKPIVAISDAEAAAQKPQIATIEPPIAGRWRWVGSSTIEFVPEKPFPLATRFTVRIAKGLAALDGSRLAEPYAFTFTTLVPEVVNSEPAKGDTRVRPDQPIKLTFNQPVQVEGHVKLLVGDGAAAKAVPFLLVEKKERIADAAPEDEGETTWRRRGGDDAPLALSSYTFKPSRPLPLDTPFHVVVDGRTPAVEGPLTVPETTLAFRTYGPLRVTKAEVSGARGPITLDTTNVVDIETLKQALVFTPPVVLDWDDARATDWNNAPQLTLTGRFEPGTAYAIELKQGYRDVFGQAGAPWRSTIKLPDLEPNVRVDDTAVLLEAGGDGALPVRAVNVKELGAKIWVIGIEDLARLAPKRWDASAALPGTPTVVRNIAVDARRNRYRWLPLDLRGVLPSGVSSGYFAVRLSAPGIQRESLVLAQISPFAVHAKLGATSGVVWVTDIASAGPAAGVEVTVYAESKPLLSAVTGADGLARFPGLIGKLPADVRGAESQLVVGVKRGSDVGAAVAQFGDAIWPRVNNSWEPFRDAAEGLGFVNPERGIYRPGDEVFLKGLLRYRKAGEILSPAPGATVKLTVKDSRSNEVLARELKTTAFGTVSTSFSLPKECALGHWSLAASFDVDGKAVAVQGGLRVEEYRAPQFLVDVSASSPSAIAGDALRADVLARYLFGGALVGGAVRWNVTRSSIDVEPAGHEGYEFGVHAWGWDDREPRAYNDHAASGETKTGADGHASIEAGTAETPGGRTFRYTIEAEVTDVNRQRIAGRAEVTVHPAAVYAGVKLEADSFLRAGSTARVALIAAAPDGTLVAAQPIELSVKKRTWKSIQKKSSGGDWFNVEEPVEEPQSSCRVTSSAAAEPATCSFTPETPGLYVLEATVRDGKDRAQTTRTMAYVVGPGWFSWSRGDDAEVELVADKPLYDVGETARVLVKSPYPECEALVTVEREGMMSIRRVHLAGAANTIDVPLDASTVPNVFVGVVLTRGRLGGVPKVADDADPGRPQARYGYVELKVETKSKRLAVDVKVDAPEKRPRQRATIDVQVRDWKGTGTAAEVTVWAVDEGILRLTGYTQPDPVEAIHPARPLLVRALESLHSLLVRRSYADEKGGDPEAGLLDVAGRDFAAVARLWGGGGGDTAGSELRSRFKTTALFAPDVVTDDAGHASVSFELPDNLTTFRIMALAVSKSDRMGTGASKVTVTKPLLALPALPRIVRVGDRFEAGVVVHSKDGVTRDVAVRAEATGLTLQGDATRSVKVAAGAPREVRFRFAADAPGTATLRFAVDGGGEKDAVEEKLPVRLPLALETVAVYGDTKERATEGIAPPRAARSDAGGLTITLASSALGGYGNVARQLLEYPYGCIEQLSSRLVPFIAQRQLQRAFGVDPAKLDAAQRAELERRNAWFAGWTAPGAGLNGDEPPDEVVRRTVTAITRLSDPNTGGFRYWPEATSCLSFDGSSYAVLALSRARAAGFPVNPDVLARGQAFLADTIAAGRSVTCWSTYTPTLTERAFAIWVRARTGEPLASYHGELFAARAKLPLYGRAMLADALLRSGDATRGRQVLNEVLGSARETAGEVHFQEVERDVDTDAWSSDARTTAIVLLTLVDELPDHPYVGKLARWLASARDRAGQYRTTQESAFTLLALAELLSTKEKDVPDFTAHVALGGKGLVAAPFKGRSLETRREDVPIGAVLGLAGEAPLTFEKSGTGVLYYTASLRYAPVRYDLDPLDRGFVVQRWFEPLSGGGQSRSFAAGELVRVRLRIATPAERRFVAIEVPLPAGLEPVDTSLATTARPSSPEPRSGGNDDDQPWRAWQYRYYDPFTHREVRDDRLLFFADQLPAGITETSFLARALTPGEFTLYPARAEEMYTPEVFGRSEGGTFVVRTP